MDQEFDIEKEIENVKAFISELTGRLKLLMALREGGYKIVKTEPGTAQDSGSDPAKGKEL